MRDFNSKPETRNSLTHLGQATVEYVMMLAVILGLVVAAGMLFDKRLGNFFYQMKDEIKQRIVGGALRGDRETRGKASGVDQAPPPTQVPQYNISYPKSGKNGDKTSE
jgi:hypothetical protein